MQSFNVPKDKDKGYGIFNQYFGLSPFPPRPLVHQARSPNR